MNSIRPESKLTHLTKTTTQSLKDLAHVKFNDIIESLSTEKFAEAWENITIFIRQIFLGSAIADDHLATIATAIDKSLKSDNIPLIQPNDTQDVREGKKFLHGLLEGISQIPPKDMSGTQKFNLLVIALNSVANAIHVEPEPHKKNQGQPDQLTLSAHQELTNFIDNMNGNGYLQEKDETFLNLIGDATRTSWKESTDKQYYETIKTNISNYIKQQDPNTLDNPNIASQIYNKFIGIHSDTVLPTDKKIELDDYITEQLIAKDNALRNN